MARIYTSGALGSGPAIDVTLDASVSSRTNTGVYITISGNLYYSYGGSLLSSAYSKYQITAGFLINGTWYEVALPFNSNAGTTGSAGTHIGSGSTTIFVSCTGSVSSITISQVRTRSTGTYTLSTSGILSARTVSISLSFSTVRYSVSYNLNGGSGSFPTQYYYYGESSINLHSSSPTKSGYNFLGWSLSPTATSPSYYAGQGWSSTNPDDYDLYAVWEVANGKSSFILSNNTIDLDNPISMYITSVSSSNTHTIVLALPTGSYTLATGVGASHTFTLSASTWAGYFTNSKSVDVTITVTTYSGSTNLGSVSASFRYYIPERRYKRGFYVFTNGEWKYCKAYVYLEKKDLVSKDEYEILDANGLELEGDDSWENIR